MRCEDYLELLSPYLDHELTPEKVAMLEAHLEECAQCNEELELLKQITVNLGSLEEKDLPQGFHEKLMGKVCEDKKHSPFYKHKVFAYASSMAAALILVVTFTQQRDERMISEQEENKPQAVQEIANQPKATAYVEDSQLASEGEAQRVEEAQGRANVRMQSMSEPDEWTMESKQVIKTVAEIEEWGKTAGYELQITLKEEEATIFFTSFSDVRELEELLKTLEELSNLQVSELISEDLMLRISQSTP